MRSNFPDRYFSKPIKMAGVHYLLERSIFEINKDILEKIGTAKSVCFIVKGNKRIMTGTLSPINISRSKLFYKIM